MGQDKGEFLSIRPASGIWGHDPEFWRIRVMSPDSQWFVGIGIDGPDVCMQRSFPIDIIPPQLNLQPPGDEEFEGIVGFV